MFIFIFFIIVQITNTYIFLLIFKMDIVRNNRIDTKNNNKTYEWTKLQIIAFQQSKLYQENLDEENKNLMKDTLFEFNNEFEKNKFMQNYEYLINKYYPLIREYKLKKHKDDENSAKEQYDKEIWTKTMFKLSDEDYMIVTITFILMIKTGKLWKKFVNNYNVGNIFYKQKDARVPLIPSNSRCLISCDNRLKVLTRFLKDYILDNVFINNKVNTNIHRAKKCYVKYTDDNGELKRKVCFDSVGSISTIIHKINDYMLLDLSNAFNNVKYEFLECILNDYLIIENENDKKNVSRSITRLIYLIKYEDKKVNLFIKRNKGIPQGSSISSDLFIICMDFILNKIISCLNENYNLKHNKDYKLICFIDDILIILKNENGKKYCNEIYYTMEKLFIQYNFELNQKKSKRSVNLNNSILTPIKNSDKYLGIYVEKNLDKYLDLLEVEIKQKYSRNPKFKSYKLIDEHLGNNNLKELEKMQIRGKLQYALLPFAKTVKERYDIFIKKKYNNIANKLFSS